MKLKSIFKSLSIALLVIGMSQSALAMENPENEKLLQASFDGSLSDIQTALEKGAKINYADKHGQTSLYLATLNNHLEIVKLLIDSGADVNHVDTFGDTPLCKVSRCNQLEFAKLLCKVSRCNQLEFAKLLIDNGADVNHANKFGDTPLHTACMSNYPDFAKLLLEHNADINLVNKDGETALDIAERKQSKIAELITEETKRRKEEEFNKWQTLCKQRLLDTWVRNYVKDPKNNLDALMPFVEKRDKHEKIAPKSQSLVNWISSLLSDFSA